MRWLPLTLLAFMLAPCIFLYGCKQEVENKKLTVIDSVCNFYDAMQPDESDMWVIVYHAERKLDTVVNHYKIHFTPDSMPGQEEYRYFMEDYSKAFTSRCIQNLQM